MALKSGWRFFIESAAVGFFLTVLLLITVPRMLREQERYASHHPDDSPASIEYTGDPLHIAIFGRGYFQFIMPDQSLVYSRVSEFIVENSRLKTRHGYTFSQLNNVSFLGGNSFLVDGAQVFSQMQGSSIANGNVFLVLFDNPAALRDVGDGYYAETAESGAQQIARPLGPEGAGALLQGYRLHRRVSGSAPRHHRINTSHGSGPVNYPNEAIVESPHRNIAAIEGEGFAGVLLPDGTPGYTRYLKLTLSEKGVPVRSFPPTHPYRSFAFEGMLTHLRNLSFPYQFGLPIIKRLQAIQEPGPAMVRAAPFDYARPLEQGESQMISITMERGIIEGPHAYAFKSAEDEWFQVRRNPRFGIEEPEEFTILTDSLRRPFIIPNAEYVHSVDELAEIDLYTFDAPEHLRYRLNGVYSPSEQSGPARRLSKDERGTIRLGYMNQVEALEP